MVEVTTTTKPVYMSSINGFAVAALVPAILQLINAYNIWHTSGVIDTSAETIGAVTTVVSALGIIYKRTFTEVKQIKIFN